MVTVEKVNIDIQQKIFRSVALLTMFKYSKTSIMWICYSWRKPFPIHNCYEFQESQNNQATVRWYLSCGSQPYCVTKQERAWETSYLWRNIPFVVLNIKIPKPRIKHNCYSYPFIFFWSFTKFEIELCSEDMNRMIILHFNGTEYNCWILIFHKEVYQSPWSSQVSY